MGGLTVLRLKLSIRIVVIYKITKSIFESHLTARDVNTRGIRLHKISECWCDGHKRIEHNIRQKLKI